MKIPFLHAAPHHLSGPLRFLLPASAGAAVPRRPAVAALAGAPDGKQRAPGTADRRHLVGRAGRALRTEPQRRCARHARQRTGGRAAGRRGAGAPGPDAQERPRTAQRALARRRMAGTAGEAAPNAGRRPAGAVAQRLGAGARHPQGPLQRTVRWRRRPARRWSTTTCRCSAPAPSPAACRPPTTSRPCSTKPCPGGSRRTTRSR